MPATLTKIVEGKPVVSDTLGDEHICAVPPLLADLHLILTDNEWHSLTCPRRVGCLCSMRKNLCSIASISLLWVVLPSSLRADTVYAYTSNPYNACSGTYAPGGINNVCPQPYALSLTSCSGGSETTVSVRLRTNTERLRVQPSLHLLQRDGHAVGRAVLGA